MGIKFTELQCREVICVSNGQRLGFVSDAIIELPEGKICALVVPGPCRYLGIAGRSEDYVIPMGSVCKIGPDIVLVDTKPEECRVRRRRGAFPL